MAEKKVAATRKTAKKATKASASTKRTRQPEGEVRAWEEDPGQPDSGLNPVQAKVPALGTGALAVVIAGRAPAPGLHPPGTADFRYWVAAEALRRGADLWSAAAPGLSWYRTVGRALQTTLDRGEDLNAYYDRRGLSFFHGRAGGKTVYSGESPDIVCHELGHAVLDALRPQLFDANFIEVASFHESFGDISGMLSALQLKSVREQILVDTAGNLYRNSRLSRMAEQLGWAIRQVAPDAVDADCLRNAANSFFYQSPESLPPSGPASTLSSEPHSFSRVFTAAFLDALEGMLRLQTNQDEQSLLQLSRDAALLLVQAITASPVVPSYYSQVAAHLIEADSDQFGGRYGAALNRAFVKRGILSMEAAHTVSLARPTGPATRRTGAAAATPRGGGQTDSPLYFVALGGDKYGLDADLMVPALAETKRFGVAGAAPNVGSATSPAHDQAAESFVEDLFRRGKVDLGVAGTAVRARAMTAPATRPSKLTHEVRREDGNLVLMRRFFDCGL